MQISKKVKLKDISPEDLAGPTALKQAVDGHNVRKAASQEESEITILPPETIFPINWAAKKDGKVPAYCDYGGHQAEFDAARCIQHHVGAYSIQWWTHSWNDRGAALLASSLPAALHFSNLSAHGPSLAPSAAAASVHSNRGNGSVLAQHIQKPVVTKPQSTLRSQSRPKAPASAPLAHPAPTPPAGVFSHVIPKSLQKNRFVKKFAGT